MLDTFQAARDHGSGWKDRLGRVGLTGRGALYGVIALLALQLAFGSPKGDASPKGAMVWIAEQPFGKFLLAVMTGALFSLAVWRFLDAAFGDPVEGDQASDRVRFAAKGTVYLGFAITSLSTTIANWGGSSTGSGAGSGDGQTQKKATAFVIGWPMGQWIVGAVGFGVIGYSVYMFKRHAIDERFMKRLSTNLGSVRTIGRVGYGARSAVLAVVGVLLIQAAVIYNPDKAGGLSAALQRLAESTGGPWLLGLVALGLFAFAAFCVAEAKYRRAA